MQLYLGPFWTAPCSNWPQIPSPASRELQTPKTGPFRLYCQSGLPETPFPFLTSRLWVFRKARFGPLLGSPVFKLAPNPFSSLPGAANPPKQAFPAVYSYIQLYRRVHACTRVYACVHVYTRVYTCTGVYTRVHVYTRVYTCIRACTRVYARVHVYARVCVRVRATRPRVRAELNQAFRPRPSYV